MPSKRHSRRQADSDDDMGGSTASPALPTRRGDDDDDDKEQAKKEQAAAASKAALRTRRGSKKPQKTTKQLQQEQKDKQEKLAATTGGGNHHPPITAHSSTHLGYGRPAMENSSSDLIGGANFSAATPPQRTPSGPDPNTNNTNNATPGRGAGLKKPMYSETTTLHKNSYHNNQRKPAKRSPTTTTKKTPPPSSNAPPPQPPETAASEEAPSTTPSPKTTSASSKKKDKKDKKKKKKRKSEQQQQQNANAASTNANVVLEPPIPGKPQRTAGQEPPARTPSMPGAQRIPGVNARRDVDDDLEPVSYHPPPQQAKQDATLRSYTPAKTTTDDDDEYETYEDDLVDHSTPAANTAHGADFHAVEARLVEDNEEDMAERIAARVKQQMEEQLRQHSQDLDFMRAENEYLRRKSRGEDPSATYEQSRSRDNSIDFNSMPSTNNTGSRELSFASASGEDDDIEESVPESAGGPGGIQYIMTGVQEEDPANVSPISRGGVSRFVEPPGAASPSREFSAVVHAVPMPNVMEDDNDDEEDEEGSYSDDDDDGNKNNDNNLICGLSLSVFVILLICGAVILGGAVAGIFIALSGNDDDETPAPTPPLQPTIEPPTISPQPSFTPNECTVFTTKFYKLYQKIGTWIDPINPSIKACDPNYKQHWSLRWMSDIDNVNINLPEQTLVDRFVMVLLYNETGGLSQNTQDQWNNDYSFLSTDPTCDWKDTSDSTDRGVICNDNGDVIELKLRDSNLQGFLPTELALLTSLVWFDFTDNFLEGQFPTWTIDMPVLERLWLTNNTLFGEIPTSIANYPALNGFDIAANRFTGSIPTEVGLISNLRGLSLRNNPLSSGIPTQLGLLSNTLDSIDFEDCQLTGTIPTFLGRLTRLDELWMEENDLSGNIPTQLGLLTALTVLFLNANNLDGTIPSHLGDLTALTTLYMYENVGLIGQVPMEFASLTNLVNFAVHDTALTGGIEETMCDVVDQVSIFERLYADCLESPPEVECSCCTNCCSSEEGCVEQDK